jgi:serine protease Do
VTARSPAARAGIEPGDILTRLDDSPLEAEKEEDLATFQRLVARVRPGQSVQIGLLRQGEPREVELEIGTQPNVEPAVAESDAGFHVQDITETLYREQRLTTRRGAFVSFVARGSPAAEAGLAPGDVVERIEKAEIDDLDGFRRTMDSIAGRGQFLVTARRGSETKFLLVKRAASARATQSEQPASASDRTSHAPAR